jgi:hypothetical protein
MARLFINYIDHFKFSLVLWFLFLKDKRERGGNFNFLKITRKVHPPYTMFLLD